MKILYKSLRKQFIKQINVFKFILAYIVNIFTQAIPRQSEQQIVLALRRERHHNQTPTFPIPYSERLEAYWDQCTERNYLYNIKANYQIIFWLYLTDINESTTVFWLFQS